jgi:hypothetical protein
MEQHFFHNIVFAFFGHQKTQNFKEDLKNINFPKKQNAPRRKVIAK